MSDRLATNYLGLELRSPVVVGACPLTMQPETVRQLVDAGAGAVVLPSMLQEQIIHRDMKRSDPLKAISQSGYQPQQDQYNGGAEAYLETIRMLTSTTKVPIVASINGSSTGSWMDYAKEIESCGAAALEMNVQPMIAAPSETSQQIEEKLCEMVHSVAERVTIPLAIKLTQRYANLASIAQQIKTAGAKGMILFTHQPQWDVSIDRMHWTIRWELSPVDSLGTILEGIVRARLGADGMSIAASGGVRTSEDAIKAMIAGADVVMVTSEIYREGPAAIDKIIHGIERFVDNSHFDSLRAFQAARPEIELGPERLMRLQYVDPLTRSTNYFDPTPAVSTSTGDSFGHEAS
ncbi:dihydroorotate dehydrogenase 2 [Roseimaritima multifibrata]|uniref:Dihydroorotate dehydrogenase 2 n=1 Tax=Roseimaritima multifibrata TaxID=1930274 RepID=A0A517MMF3_9BACT|nr:dihydroorotate dehydrogenase-like protein [Roseimaritima multifibrata]QDS96054.1 dihydroorotate dehydrogenase 2 [Roseimaritima multifibrata]